ncbi:hypothetical protein QTN25_010272 [Entamoeba marina]
MSLPQYIPTPPQPAQCLEQQSTFYVVMQQPIPLENLNQQVNRNQLLPLTTPFMVNNIAPNTEEKPKKPYENHINQVIMYLIGFVFPLLWIYLFFRYAFSKDLYLKLIGISSFYNVFIYAVLALIFFFLI